LARAPPIPQTHPSGWTEIATTSRRRARHARTKP
jgi:hypothetical protein